MRRDKIPNQTSTILFATVLWLGSYVSAQPGPTELAQSARSFQVVPGVIVSDDRIFAMRPEGGIEALQATSGEVLWANSSAAKPLALFGNQLLTQIDERNTPDTLKLLFVGAQTGASRGTFDLALPTGTWGEVDQRLGTAFDVTATQLEGQLYLAWHSVRGPAGGVHRLAEPSATTEATAVYRMDSAAGDFEPVDAVPPTEEDLPFVQLPATQVFKTPPFLSGSMIVATAASTAQQGQNRVLLKRWDPASGNGLPDVELYGGSAVLEYPSADRHHLLVSQRVASGSFEEYRWLVFDLETGQLAGQVDDHRSHSRFFVSGTTLVHEVGPFGRRIAGDWIEQPRRLVALDLASGEQVWERVLRDPADRGPLPP